MVSLGVLQLCMVAAQQVSSFQHSSSGKEPQMEELTKRKEKIITHTATAHIACSQREWWHGLKMLWLAILNRTTTCSTSYTANFQFTYTTTAYITWLNMEMRLATLQKVFPVLQVMDKGIHKPFKTWLKEELITWMKSHQQGENPIWVDVATWIQQAWDNVLVASIINTWQSIAFQPMNNPWFSSGDDS